ncbi:MAG: NAD-dependent DNA ligase LigA [Lachnospiraceae bacterium]|nr:NAD-dependent DNA ligase LigA [Lachnospiraceae bacterium]
MDSKKRIEELTELLNRASEKYYNGSEEIMSNFEWDAAFDELKRLEEETGYVLPESPTGNTGYEPEGRDKITHEYRALSLAKTMSVEDLKKWAGDREIWLSWKLDGLTLVATYDNGTLTHLATRGNGIEGNNITYLSGAIEGVVREIPYKGHFVVRGEATISYTDFNLINDTTEDEEKYANPRNLAAGTLNLDDPEKVALRHVRFNAFTLVHTDEHISSWGERMSLLESYGFTVVEREKTDAKGLDEVISRWTKRVEDGSMDIPVDGLVLCYEDNDYAMSGSVTGHHQLTAGYAFKWQDTSADTRLKYIEWSCAVSTITPVAVFDSVELEGTKVSRASLCNLSELKRLGMGGEGSIVTCIKSNKIIPKIIAVKEKKGLYDIPENCPVCLAPTSIRLSERSGVETLHCTNPDCPAKHLKMFTRFVSKSGMNIDGLSIRTMLDFMNMGYIKMFADIYSLPLYFDEIRTMDGYGEKSCENMGRAIERSRSVPAVNLIYALCIPMIGLDAAKNIITAVGFEEFLERMRNGTGFEDIEGIGPEKSASVLKWYADERNVAQLAKLLPMINVTGGEAVHKADIELPLKGKTFVITGAVHTFKNRDGFKAYVEELGGSVTGSVSKKTDYLVNNDTTSTSAKNLKANELKIPIISEDEFIERFGKPDNI